MSFEEFSTHSLNLSWFLREANLDWATPTVSTCEEGDLIFLFRNYLFLFNLSWCFSCMCVWVKVLDLLKLELQTTTMWVLGIELWSSR